MTIRTAPRWRAGLALALGLAGVMTQPAAAQDGGRLVTLLGVRSATVAPDGLGFGSVAISSRRSDLAVVDEADGSIVLGFGLGSATDGIGVQATANITSLSDDFGDSGSLGVKASRRVLAGQVPVYAALSADRLGGWGDAEEVDETVSAIATAFPQAQLGGAAYPIMLTLGAGTNLRDDFTEPAVFGGAGVGLSRSLGASLAWTGDAVTVGAAFRIPGLDSMRFSAAVSDAFDQRDSRRLTLTATVLVQDLFGG